MALSTFKQKVEERLKSGSPGDVSAGPPPAKKSCSTYEKQMQNLPPGNLDLDLYLYGQSFKDETIEPGSHPASLVLEKLNHVDEHTRFLYCQELQTWYSEYANWRGKAYLFKGQLWRIVWQKLSVIFIKALAYLQSTGTLDVPSAADLMLLEDQANAAKFREIRALVAQDIANMCQYNASVEEHNRRLHVVQVMHERGQVEVGKELCEGHMEKFCRISLAIDKSFADVKLDTSFRQAAATNKVDVNQIHTVLYVDCTKLGVLQQQEINTIGDLAEKHLSRNPARSVLVLIPPLLVLWESFVAEAAWRSGQPPMDRTTPKYRKEICPEDLPRVNEKPQFRICQLSADGKFTLPADIRSQWMSDAVWGPEWRDIVKQFDKQWSGQETSPATPGATPSPPKPSSHPQKKEDEDAKMEPNFDWAVTFKNEPETLEALKSKVSDCVEIPGGPAYQFVMAGSKLYIAATDALHLTATSAPILTHGAGAWLVGDKAKKSLESAPDRGFVCAFVSDSHQVILEEGNSDSGLLTLRSAIQKIEAAGHVDFTLGGHTCQRPSSVQQGKADDHFEIGPDTSSTLLWRPHNVPSKNVKAANLASQFTAQSLEHSPLYMASCMDV
ncbi:Uncharacterized protein SCF082_LOCUS42073 [Durusdinium trenchii]|uniref:Uncharacterized protein n=1 Tax=Durusdinium trenchii TaxID=1381693 RepID=A0ABP0QND7_9DINO